MWEQKLLAAKSFRAADYPAETAAQSSPATLTGGFFFENAAVMPPGPVPLQGQMRPGPQGQFAVSIDVKASEYLFLNRLLGRDFPEHLYPLDLIKGHQTWHCRTN